MKNSSFFRSAFKNRHLALQLARREVIGRYRGSFLGFLWSFITPIIMLGVYTFVFSVVFKARWGTLETNRFQFALVLFSGLIVYNLFAECIIRAPTTVINNANYVKKVVFPLEILPWVNLLSALFHMTTNLLVLVLFIFVVNGSLSWTVILFPVIMIPLVLIVMGVSWLLASLGVFVRDIGQLVGILTTVLLFMSPVFYPLSSVPERFRQVLLLNPLSYFVEDSRSVLIWGHTPNWTYLGLWLIASMLTAWVGFWWFQKTKKGFADVI